METILIFGSSGHARSIIDLVERAGGFRIAGLIDSFRKPGESTLGYRVLGGESDLLPIVQGHGVQGMIVAVGHNEKRAAVVQRLQAVLPSLSFPSVVHPTACLARSVVLCEGTVVMAGVVVNTGCRIGKFCILNTACVLEHDGIMEDFSSLGPGALVAGTCHIGASSAICLGARLIQRVTIGTHTLVGAGSTVLGPIGSFVVAHGTPACAIRPRSEGEEYL